MRCKLRQNLLHYTNKKNEMHYTNKQEPKGALIAHLSTMSTVCEISPNSKQSQYFNSGYEDAFVSLLLHSDLKKKSFGEGAPH